MDRWLQLLLNTNACAPLNGAAAVGARITTWHTQTHFGATAARSTAALFYINFSI